MVEAAVKSQEQVRDLGDSNEHAHNRPPNNRGRTAYENIKGYHSVTPVSEFGEPIVFLPLGTNNCPSKFEDKWKEGVWLEVTM